MHVAHALQSAIRDAGLRREDIDGIMINSLPDTLSMDNLPALFGLPNVEWAFQSWRHGRMQPTVIAVAAWAILNQQADYVACLSTGQRLAQHRNRYPGFDGAIGAGSREQTEAARTEEIFREGGGPHLEVPHHGMVSVGGGAALAMQKYLSRYGGDASDLGEVAVAQRQWAQFNSDAYFCGRSLTMEEYLASPYIIEPLRIFDHCLPGHAAFCLILTSAERATDSPKPPVHIGGVQGSASGPETFVFGRTGLGVAQQSEASPRHAADMLVYRIAEVGPQDVNIVGILDAFSPLVVFGLEEFGFCEEGTALEWLRGGRMGPGGELPINVGGGGLSDVESFGWGHEIEMVRQLRGESGEGQVADAEVCQYISTDRSSIIFLKG